MTQRSNIEDYLPGLQSDSSASAAYTIPYADSEGTLSVHSVDSFPSSIAGSPQRPVNTVSPTKIGHFGSPMHISQPQT